MSTLQLLMMRLSKCNSGGLDELREILREKVSINPRKVARPLSAPSNIDPKNVVFKYSFRPGQETISGYVRIRSLRAAQKRCLTIDHSIGFLLKPALFLESWKKTESGNTRCILFDATIMAAPEEFYSVLYLWWDDKRLRCGERWIDNYQEYSNDLPEFEFQTAVVGS